MTLLKRCFIRPAIHNCLLIFLLRKKFNRNVLKNQSPFYCMESMVYDQTPVQLNVFCLWDKSIIKRERFRVFFLQAFLFFPFFFGKKMNLCHKEIKH